MAEEKISGNNTNKKEFRRSIRHRGKITQIPIYLGKLLRGFVYLNDWKVLPMAAVIAALVGMVIRTGMFVTMESTRIGALAVTCVAIWNGCFNSVQVICRERGIIKREHRSGMHISSYIASHMIYQGLLCLAQTVLTVYVYKFMGVKFPEEGFITRWITLDISITLFLVTYASDMIALLISAIARTTTTAMTVMPFVLIFQLVFSGAMFTLPESVSFLSKFTVSNYGMRCVTMQADYNNLDLTSGWTILNKISAEDVNLETTVGKVSDTLTTSDAPLIQSIRAIDFENSTDTDAEASEAADAIKAIKAETGIQTLGDLIDLVAESPAVTANRDMSLKYTLRIKDVIDLFGEGRVKAAVIDKSSSASRDETYERSSDNIWGCWGALILISLCSALAAMTVLEFIDHDKR